MLEGLKRAFAALVAAAGLNVGTRSEAIVMLHDVEPERYLAAENDFPFVFGIYRGKLGQPDCLAMLVAECWALTAAHCTEDPPLLKALEDGTGFPVTIAGRANGIDRAVRHPSWQGEATSDVFDLTLVHLAEPVEGVDPVALGTGSNEVGSTVLIVGWGDPGTGLTGPVENDGAFRKARNRVDGANERWIWWAFDDPREGEALPLEGISGPGDSGGPAFIADANEVTLVGVSSSQVTGGGPEGVYGVVEYYVRVSAAVDWIRSVILGQGCEASASKR